MDGGTVGNSRCSARCHPLLLVLFQQAASPSRPFFPWREVVQSRMPKDAPRSNAPSSQTKQAAWFDWSLLAGAVLLVIMISPVLAGRIYTFNDLGDFHLPFRVFYSEQVAQQESFVWTPQIFCGYYVAGEGQVGMFHPWHLLLYAVFPVRLAFACEVVGNYPLIFAGAYLFLRRRLRRRDAALFGGLLFTFGSFNLLHFVHVNAIAVVAHIPWLLWAMDVMVLDTGRRRVTAAQVGVALLTGSQMLLGYPQYVWFSLLAEVGYLLFVCLDRRHPADGSCLERPVVVRRCVGWAFAKAAGLLIGGIQLVPTMDVLQDSVRHSVSADYANWGSLHPLNLVQLVAPYLFATRVVGRNTHELGVYLGAVPLMLVVWLLCQHRQLGLLRRFNWAIAAMGLLALWLALGKYGLLYSLQRWLPIVGGFRCPCRYVMLFQFAASVMAAIAFLLLLRQRERNEPIAWSKLKPLVIPVMLSVVAAVAPWVFSNIKVFGSTRAVLLGPLLIGMAALLVALLAHGVRWAPAALILFAAADLGLYGLSYAVFPGTIKPSEQIANMSTPPGWPLGRVLMNPEPVGEKGVHYDNKILLTGWDRADGYTGLEPQKRLDYRKLAALRVAGVRWVMKNELTVMLPGLIPQGSWFEVPDPLPQAYLVSAVRQSSRPAEDITKIPVETTALVESPLELPTGEPGIATLYGDRPGRMEIWVECSTPQLLVVSQRYHPGWQAVVEGETREVLRVNGDFMGCVVQPGEHRVQLTFQPRSLRYGAIVSCIGLGLLASLSVVGLLSRSGRAAPAG